MSSEPSLAPGRRNSGLEGLSSASSTPPPGSEGENGSSSSRKPPKSRRKISMPWFRQSSFGMSLARLRLPKQHTIATPDEAGNSPKKVEGSDSNQDLRDKLVSPINPMPMCISILVSVTLIACINWKNELMFCT